MTRGEQLDFSSYTQTPVLLQKCATKSPCQCTTGGAICKYLTTILLFLKVLRIDTKIPLKQIFIFVSFNLSPDQVGTQSVVWTSFSIRDMSEIPGRGVNSRRKCDGEWHRTWQGTRAAVLLPFVTSRHGCNIMLLHAAQPAEYIVKKKTFHMKFQGSLPTGWQFPLFY